MSIKLATLLGALPSLVPMLGEATAVAKLVGEIVHGLPAKDQATATAAIADLQAENDEGHRRYQEKLAAAAKA